MAGSNGSNRGSFAQATGYAIATLVSPPEGECLVCGGPLGPSKECVRWKALLETAQNTPSPTLTAGQRSFLVASTPEGLQSLGVQPTLVAYDGVMGEGGLDVGDIIWGLLVLIGAAGTALGEAIQGAIESAVEWYDREAYVRLWRVVGQSEMQSIWNSRYREYGVANNSTEKRFWLSREQALDYEHRMAQGANRGRASYLTSIRLRIQYIALMHWGTVADTPILNGVYCSIDLGNPATRAAFPYWYRESILFHGQLRDWNMDQISKKPLPEAPAHQATA